jgi:hypothetical protein
MLPSFVWHCACPVRSVASHGWVYWVCFVCHYLFSYGYFFLHYWIQVLASVYVVCAWGCVSFLISCCSVCNCVFIVFELLSKSPFIISRWAVSIFWHFAHAISRHLSHFRTSPFCLYWPHLDDNLELSLALIHCVSERSNVISFTSEYAVWRSGLDLFADSCVALSNRSLLRRRPFASFSNSMYFCGVLLFCLFEYILYLFSLQPYWFYVLPINEFNKIWTLIPAVFWAWLDKPELLSRTVITAFRITWSDPTRKQAFTLYFTN